MSISKLLTLSCLAVTILAGSFSCSKSKSADHCGNIEFRPLELVKYTDQGNRCVVNIQTDKIEDKFFVINSREELDAHISYASNGTNPPCQSLKDQFVQIDFSKETLLIGKAIAVQIEPMLISQKVVRDCATNKIRYQVRISIGGFTAIGLFRYGVVIPKSAAKNGAIPEIEVVKSGF